MATNVEKINFNVPANLKKDIERLAISHGKTLSSFMVDVCSILVKNNAERIKAQAQREKEPINFGVADVKTTKTAKPKAKKAATKKTAAPSEYQLEYPANSAAALVQNNDDKNTRKVHVQIEKGDTQPRTVTVNVTHSDENVNGVDDNG